MKSFFKWLAIISFIAICQHSISASIDLDFKYRDGILMCIGWFSCLIFIVFRGQTIKKR